MESDMDKRDAHHDLPAQEFVTILGDGDEVDVVLPVPPGMTKLDFVTGKLMGGHRRVMRLLEATTKLAQIADGKADTALDGVTFVKRVGGGLIGLLGIVAVILEILSRFGAL